MKRYLLIILMTGFVFSEASQAQVSMKKVGQSTMNFLEVGISPRAAGLGNAYTAICDDAESIFYNPAGLAGTSSGYSVFLSQTQWIADINYTAGAITKSFGNLGTVGISVLSVNYGDIQGAIPVEGGEGYELTGNVDLGAYAFGLAYARQISSQFYMGGLIQYVGQKLGSNNLETGTVKNTANKLTLNFGVKYITNFKKFSFAMAIRNFSTEVKYEEYNTQMPLIFNVGASIDLMEFFSPNQNGAPLTLSAEFQHPNNYTERVNIGCEYTLMKMFALRAGYEFNRDLAGFSAGVGVTPDLLGGKFGINYSYSAFDVFDAVNRFSLNVKF